LDLKVENDLVLAGLEVSDAILQVNPEWELECFPPGTALVYPLLPSLALGHSLQFSASLRLSESGRSLLRRVLVVLTHRCG
jgi:hypothetical protein